MTTTKQHVCVIGAGIAGLTAAHELIRRGYAVTVYESEPDAGGFFRSAVLPEHEGMPSEYSWHGFGPWYHNTFEVMRQIHTWKEEREAFGFGNSATVSNLRTPTTPYESALSKPINFGLAFDDGTAEFASPRRMFKASRLDALRGAWLMLKTWTADLRSDVDYSQVSASEAFSAKLSSRAWRAWRACFGPWVGSDWTRVSLHHVGVFFRRNFFSGPKHQHDRWAHGSRDGWLVLKGPSSDAWFAPWVKYLEAMGVKFEFGRRLNDLQIDGDRISRVCFDGMADPRFPLPALSDWVEADHYVLAISPFAARDVFDRSLLSAMLSRPPQPRRGLLADLHRQHVELIADGPHTQVSFRIAFAEPIAWKLPRQAVVLADSPWNITIFAQEQAWGSGSLGDGVQALWTGTACVSSVPGRVFGLPLERCTLEQFKAEVFQQLAACHGLEGCLALSGIPQISIRFEVWHEWLFSSEGITPKHPKWVTTTNTQRHKPDQRTQIPNLVLAGAHTKTDADVWSIEGAVESGRRAAKLIAGDVAIIPQHKPVLLRAISAVDNLCFRLRLPHVLDLALALTVLALIALVIVGVAT